MFFEKQLSAAESYKSSYGSATSCVCVCLLVSLIYRTGLGLDFAHSQFADSKPIPTRPQSSNLIGKKFLLHNCLFVCASVGACVGLQVPVHVQRSKEGIEPPVLEL